MNPNHALIIAAVCLMLFACFAKVYERMRSPLHRDEYLKDFGRDRYESYMLSVLLWIAVTGIAAVSFAAVAVVNKAFVW